MKARNSVAHNAITGVSDEEARKLIKFTRSYQSLLHRIILRVLGYNDYYTDYFMDGFPSKSLAIPIGKGKAAIPERL